MQFKPELIDLIRQCAKTQTRRVVKPNERHIGFMPGTRFSQCVAQLKDDKPARIKWQVGRVYAICPGRGKKGVGHICVNRIRCEEDVRNISVGDSWAEGFSCPEMFLATWIHLNDHSASAWYSEEERRWHWYHRGWHTDGENGASFADYMAARPPERYRAWALDFEWIGE